MDRDTDQQLDVVVAVVVVCVCVQVCVFVCAYMKNPARGDRVEKHHLEGKDVRRTLHARRER